MKLSELDKYLVEKEDELEWHVDDKDHLLLKLTKYDEEYKITPKAIGDMTIKELDDYLFGGRNVDHITRVTGYFAKTSGFNKGKTGELKDRHKTPIN